MRELAERVAGQRLRAGEALEFVAAEVFSAISIDPAFAERPEESPAQLGSDGTSGPEQEAEEEPAALAARGPARALPRAIASLAAGLAEADAFELDRRLRLAVRLEQTLDAAIAPLLRVVTCAEYEWKGEFQTLSSYACEQLGMSVSKARALLRLERDGYRCAVPGCTSRRNLHDHHIRFRSAGGPDAPRNRITLCAFHHQRGLHARLLRVSGPAPDGLVFELGLRAGAAPLARYRSGDIVVPQPRGRC